MRMLRIAVSVVVLAVLSFVFTGRILTQDNGDEAEFREGTWDRRVDLNISGAPVQQACDQLAEVGGISVVLQVGVVPQLDRENVKITLRLTRVHLHEAVSIMAEQLDLVPDFRENAVLFKRPPLVSTETMIGRIILKDKDHELTLNIYAGEISAEVKRELVNAMIERKLRGIHVEREQFEFKMEMLERKLDAERREMRDRDIDREKGEKNRDIF